ncbi:MAG: tRNA 2-thiouridine(34) synthase MnmA [Actinobacteria bacterium]|nr:tRNA 2-thiouridine(34) synthase MnmA [Actinomycetota bacterium]
MKVIAAMSGGVDSAVAAARAVDAGHDVTGVHLALARSPASLRTGARGCCTAEDARDARRAADVIGIPFYVWDLAERFDSQVIEDFVDEYAVGRTPNPCLRCNERIKFAAVLDKAIALGFDAVVTGHHARLDGGVLRRSVDPAKDQSYVLAVLTADQLAHADSHDVCFIADGDTAGFLRRRIGAAAGPIVDQAGTVLGGHDGAFAYTVGQRRGLRIDRPAPDGRPRYVLDISPATNTVTVGPAEHLDIDQVSGVRPVWTSGRPPASPYAGIAQLRAHGCVVPCTARLEDGWVEVDLHEPVRGVARGQAVVLYDGDRVVGSATIDATGRAAARP